MKTLLFISAITTILAVSAYAESDTGASRGLQMARRLALKENTKNLPSLGYKLSSLVVKRAKKSVQAVNIKQENKKKSFRRVNP